MRHAGSVRSAFHFFRDNEPAQVGCCKIWATRVTPASSRPVDDKLDMKSQHFFGDLRWLDGILFAFSPSTGMT
jgi:hypothetical protein